MIERVLRVLMTLALLALVISPIIGIICWIMEGFKEIYFGFVFVGLIVGIASVIVSSILQYIFLGQFHPLYLFRKNING